MPIAHFCQFHPEIRARARSLCPSCYERWARGTLKVEGIPSRQPHTDAMVAARRKRAQLPAELLAKIGEVDPATGLPIEFRDIITTDKVRSGGAGYARRLIERFMFAPQRVGAIMQRFFMSALVSDKVLVEYVKMLVPQKDNISPVQVVINAPAVLQRTGAIYDVTGEEVIDANAEAVDVPKVSISTVEPRKPIEDLHQVS